LSGKSTTERNKGQSAQSRAHANHGLFSPEQAATTQRQLADCVAVHCGQDEHECSPSEEWQALWQKRDA
jgi:hypothetical protein